MSFINKNRRNQKEENQDREVREEDTPSLIQNLKLLVQRVNIFKQIKNMLARSVLTINILKDLRSIHKAVAKN